MKTLYLHVGFHKTGTSSIQAFLHNQRRQLLSLNVLYPITGLAGNAHGDLANSLKINYDLRKKQDLFANFNKELDEFQGDRIIISSECFMESINPETIYDHFRKENLEIKIIMYVRPQPAWAESLFNEIVKDSSRRYSGSILNMREIRRGDLNYYGLIDRWAKAFGDMNIIIRPFEREQLVKGLYHDFLCIIDADLINKIQLPTIGDNRNISWDRRCVEFLRRINLIPMKREMHRQIVGVLDSVSNELQSRFNKESNGHINQNDVKRILKMSGNSNIKVAQKWLAATNNRSLFISDSWVERFSKPPIILSAEVENWLYEQLPENIQTHLKHHSPKISARIPGDKFLPTPPFDEETRLRCEILRLRMELNWIYAS